MESWRYKYWRQLYEFDMYDRHDCPFFIILDRTWDNYGGNFFLRPNVKELNLWI